MEIGFVPSLLPEQTFFSHKAHSVIGIELNISIYCCVISISTPLFPAGVKAFRQLIAEATFVPSKHGQYHNKFVKYGDINTAYRDFYATNPQSVSEEGYKGVCVIKMSRLVEKKQQCGFRKGLTQTGMYSYKGRL